MPIAYQQMKLQLKRSSVLVEGFAKEPTTAQMEYGELAVNYNLDDPCIFIKDSGNNIIRISNAGIPITGDINLQPGTLDERYLMLKGGTMTGPINLSTNSPTADLEAASKKYVDESIVNIQIPAAPDTAPTPPEDPETGQLWWNTIDGRLYIWYEDIDSEQWVPATPESGGVEVQPDGGLEEDAGGDIGIKVRPNYGLSTSSEGLQIDVRSGYGISVSALGIQIDDDWSSIPVLPEA